MSVKKPWVANGSFIHEKVLFSSAIFIFLILIFDWFAEVLPIDGYGLIIICLFLSCIATWKMLCCVQWLLKQKKPLVSSPENQSKQVDGILVKWFLDQLKNNESIIFYKIFHSDIFKNLKLSTNVIEQIKLFIIDIQREYVVTWYSNVSRHPMFLTDLHIILDDVGFKLIERCQKININDLVLNLLTIYLQHLQEYKRAKRKLFKKQFDNGLIKLKIEDFYRHSHCASYNDELFQFYLEKVSKHVLAEYSPNEFSNSISFKIIYNIIARKVLGSFVGMIEDPNWINLELLYLINCPRYDEVTNGKIYYVPEKYTNFTISDGKFRVKSLLLNRKISHNIFVNTIGNIPKKPTNNINNDMEEKPNLTLPIQTTQAKQQNNISCVLGGLITSTAGPLLPDNFSLQYQPLNKMWQSPVTEEPVDVPQTKSNPFRKNVIEGIKVQDIKPIKERRALVRSKSTDTMSILDDTLCSRDISIGEELSENVKLSTSKEHVNVTRHGNKKLIKTRSFDSTTIADEDLDKELFYENCVTTSDENIRDVSPVYEEAEDLSTSIAKLRSLLEQRESSSTLSDKSTHSIDSQVIFGKDSLDQQMSIDKPQPVSDESIDTSSDIPNDGRLFINIHIPKTELHNDPGSSPYILYTIQYDGVYLVKDQDSVEDQSHLVLQTTTVKRRFQEFINLQTRLEDNNNIKNALKGVKGPSKWLNISFTGKTDEMTTASRKPVLESFLQQLCSKVEISTSHELQEFLGYGTDSSNAFIKKDSPFSVQRIDKFLANKVTGVFNSIKTALPTFDFDQISTPTSTEAIKTFQDQNLLQSLISFGNRTEIKELKSDFVIRDKTNDNLRSNIRQYFTQRYDCIEDALEALDSSNYSYEFGECHPVNKSGACVWTGYLHSPGNDETEDIDAWVPHLHLTLNIICELIQDSRTWFCKEQTIHVIKVIFGHWENRFKEEVGKLDWDKIMGNCLKLLRETLFAQHPTNDEGLNVLDLDLASKLKQTIESAIPDNVLQFISQDLITASVDLFVSSLQHMRLNRDVILRVFDLLFAQLLSCPHSIDTT